MLISVGKVTMMSRITLNLSMQRDRAALNIDTSAQMTRDIRNTGILSFFALPPLPASLGQAMSTGWIMNTGTRTAQRPNTGTSSRTATTLRVDERPTTGSSDLTAVSARGRSREGAQSGLGTGGLYDAIGRVESGTNTH